MNNNYSQSIPKIGLGTYNMTPEEAEIMTFESIKHGYRHIDTAAVYRNEEGCLLYTSPSPRDLSTSRMPSSA